MKKEYTNTPDCNATLDTGSRECQGSFSDLGL